MDLLRDFFARLVGNLEPFAQQMGAPGLAVVAFLDSSFISLPQLTDALVFALTLETPSLWLVHALATTFGSVAGCFVLYGVVKKGGEAFLRRRFKERHIDGGLRLVQRHGWVAVAVPALMPPPTPFKLFVLLAGIAEIRPVTFAAAVGLGRGLRYGGEAYLTYRYGARATEFIGANLPAVSLSVAAAFLVGGAGLVFWRRRRDAAA